jgi:IS30 family transposase
MDAMGIPRFGREVQRRFWVLIVQGWSIELAAAEIGVSLSRGRRWSAEAGAMAPMSLAEPTGRYLSFSEREEIALGRAAGLGVREIARRLGRSPSTVSRELARGCLTRRPRGRYKASVAQARADVRARRPRPAKLSQHRRLREWVADKLHRLQWSPNDLVHG